MLRRYQDGDLEKIKLQKEQTHEDRENWYLFNSPDTLVFEDGDRVLAIVLPIFEGGGRVYLSALIGADCRDKGVSMFKKMKRIIDGWLENGEVFRVEMTTQCDFKQANRLAFLLGFKRECVMEKYFNGIDFYLWGRVK